MDNYKIKVTDEVSNTEIQEALFELGCEWFGSTNEVKPLANCWIDVGSNGRLTWSFHGSDEKELTLPQLQDLVVLKRNDSRDANVNQGGEIPCLYDLYLTADKELYFYHCGKGKWLLSNLNHDEDYYATLKPIEKSEHQDPALISGAEALRALADGKDVQWATGDEFQDVTGQWEIREFSHPSFRFRLKPTTLIVNAELPKPEREFQRNKEVFSVTYEFKTREERNAFADKLRGTNS
ncbi:TPA: hypothetical protein MW161_000578 [Acinetobacter baumannii]|nr:hypothetical protein [Acinetobacter baumannii]